MTGGGEGWEGGIMIGVGCVACFRRKWRLLMAEDGDAADALEYLYFELV